MNECTLRFYRICKQHSKLFSKSNTLNNGIAGLFQYKNGITPSVIPTRNTMIVKRPGPTLLYKSGNKPRLLQKDFFYELVENTDCKPETTIDVVLTSYVQGVGNPGDIVTMKRSDAYNQLLITGLAGYPTPENLEYSRKLKKDVVAQEKLVSPSVEFTMDYLKDKIILILMNKENEWTIEPWHIRSNFLRSGIQILSDSQIMLPTEPIKGPNMDLQDKDFYVTVTINKRHKVNVRCRIHHWSTSAQNRLPLDLSSYDSPNELIFPEAQT